MAMNTPPGTGQVVSAHEYVRAAGSAFVVFQPGCRLLLLGYGSDPSPRVVPHCIAVNTASSAAGTGDRRRSTCAAGGGRDEAGTAPLQQTAGSSEDAWRCDDDGFAALLEVHRLLHLPAPPQPPAEEELAAWASTRDAALAAGSAPPSAGDPFPGARAGMLSVSDSPEGADGFVWTQTRRSSRQQQQQQQQQGTDTSAQMPQDQQEQQQQQQRDEQRAAVCGGDHLPQLAGTPVAALWHDEPYVTQWLMTPGGRISGFGTTPDHVLLDRFDAVWRWALSMELGLGAAGRARLGALLLVPPEMSGDEVSLLAEVLLTRLGFASLAVHLTPVAAAVGAGASAAVVVHLGPASARVCCVDDGALVGQPRGAGGGPVLTLPLGVAGVGAALVAWAAAYGAWPSAATVAGLGPAAALGAGGKPDCPYGCFLLADLVAAQAYIPQDSLAVRGLAGQPMLEEAPPVQLPLRAPGQRTRTLSLSLGSWAAIAPCTYFLPALAPRAHRVSAAAALAGSGSGCGGCGSCSGCAFLAAHAAVQDLPAGEALQLEGQAGPRSDGAAPPDGLYLPASCCRSAAAGAAGGPNTAAAAAPLAGGDDATVGVDPLPLDEAVFRAIVAAAAAKPALLERLCSGVLLTGPGAALRGLGPVLERRLMARFSRVGRAQAVSVLEIGGGDPRSTAWRGGALLGALDAGRESWLLREQWVAPGAASARHTRLVFYLRAEQGLAVS